MASVAPASAETSLSTQPVVSNSVEDTRKKQPTIVERFKKINKKVTTNLDKIEFAITGLMLGRTGIEHLCGVNHCRNNPTQSQIAYSERYHTIAINLKNACVALFDKMVTQTRNYINAHQIQFENENCTLQALHDDIAEKITKAATSSKETVQKATVKKCEDTKRKKNETEEIFKRLKDNLATIDIFNKTKQSLLKEYNVEIGHHRAQLNNNCQDRGIWDTLMGGTDYKTTKEVKPETKLLISPRTPYFVTFYEKNIKKLEDEEDDSSTKAPEQKVELASESQKKKPVVPKQSTAKATQPDAKEPKSTSEDVKITAKVNSSKKAEPAATTKVNSSKKAEPAATTQVTETSTVQAEAKESTVKAIETPDVSSEMNDATIATEIEENTETNSLEQHDTGASSETEEVDQLD